MTPDERTLLQTFLGDLTASRGATKDAEADGLIADALRANPDAGYLLVQHAILADQSLQAAQQRIAMLEQAQGAPPPGPVSFLGGPTAPYAPPGGSYGQQVEPYPQQGGGQYGGQYGGWGPPPQPHSPLSPNGGLGGFLKTAGVLAAGVAGGDFLANGLENLFAPRRW